MKKTNLLTCGLAALALFSTIACSSTKVAVEPAKPKEISSYIRTWPIGTTPEQMAEGKHWTAEDVKGEYLTELIVAFAHIDPETWGIKFPDVEPADPNAVPFPELWDEVAKLQAKYPDLAMRVSIGGYGADDFSPMAADPEKRAKFIAAVVDLVKEKKLNGIDIDWEYPIGPDWGQPIKSDPADADNFIILLNELRAALKAVEAETGYVSLSIAVVASGWFPDKIDCKALADAVDTMKLMSYDYYGGWSGQTGHLANLYTNPADPDWGGWSTDAAVQKYLADGVPAEKLILGLAFYGRGWKGVEPGPNGDGLYQKYKESAFGDGLSWSDMEKTFTEGNFKIYWDDVAKAPYMYNGDEFITYTDPEAIQYICDYANEKGLGGVMVWEYGHDMDCELFPVLVNSIAPEPDPSAEVSEK